MRISCTDKKFLYFWYDGDFDTLTIDIDGKEKVCDTSSPLVQAIIKLSHLCISGGSYSNVKSSWLFLYLKYYKDTSKIV